ncbi:MAG: 30S ribosomal protein S2 [Candidatus Omnitrophica bacterium]|nr:30S ribosomal protein S2 [Candidatus Omnitrophota bacterium]
MPVISQVVKDLLENGVHFGHQASKWNPKMKEYIFGRKSGICIIDLEKTEAAMKKATDFLYDLSRKGKKVIFVGTKKQAKQIIKEEAQRSGMFYVDERWLGGCLTNFETILKSVDRLTKIEKTKQSETYTELAKKERVKLEREEDKLNKNFFGIKEMKKVPDAMIVIDSDAEKIAVLEARKMGIPVVAVLDTNCDPGMVQFPIPANDDAIRSIRYILAALTDAVVKGRSEFDGTAAPVRKVQPEPVREEKPAPAAEEKPAQAAAQVKPKEEVKDKPAAEKKPERAPRVEKTEAKKSEKPEAERTTDIKKLEEEEKNNEGDISLS